MKKKRRIFGTVATGLLVGLTTLPLGAHAQDWVIQALAVCRVDGDGPHLNILDTITLIRNPGGQYFLVPGAATDWHPPGGGGGAGGIAGAIPLTPTIVVEPVDPADPGGPQKFVPVAMFNVRVDPHADPSGPVEHEDFTLRWVSETVPNPDCEREAGELGIVIRSEFEHDDPDSDRHGGDAHFR